MPTTETRPEPERARELIDSVRSRMPTQEQAAVEVGHALVITLGYIAGGDERRRAAALERADVYLEEIRALLGLARGGAR